MNADTHKTWTLHLTPEDAPGATFKGIPQDEVASLLWKTLHGYGPIEQLATETASRLVREDRFEFDERIAA